MSVKGLKLPFPSNETCLPLKNKALNLHYIHTTIKTNYEVIKEKKTVTETWSAGKNWKRALHKPG